MFCPKKKQVTETRSSLVISFFIYLNVCGFIRPWLAQYSVVYLLSKKDPAEHIFLENLKIIFEPGTRTQDCLRQNIFTQFMGFCFNVNIV